MVGRKLGRGLDFLLSRDRSSSPPRGEEDKAAKKKAEAGPVADESGSEQASQTTTFIELAPDQLSPNPFQPREDMDEGELEKLAASIRASGILQPLLARRQGEGFELIAGERRLRAAKLAGLTKLPVLLREASEEEMRLLALVENVQRQDLNPIEKAQSFAEIRKASGWTQKELAAHVGLERSSLANYIRLLDLPQEVQQALKSQELSMGHARALLSAPTDKRLALAREAISQRLSVRETERLTRELLSDDTKASVGKKKAVAKAAWMREMEGNLLAALGCKVAVSFRSGKGRIQLEIGNRDEFDRVYELLMSALPQSSEDELVAKKIAKKG